MDIPDRDQIEHLPAAAVYKWIFIVAVNLCVPYQVLMSLLGWLGFATAEWRMEPVTLFGVIVLAPFYGLLAAVFVTVCFGSAFLAMRWVFGKWEAEDQGPT